MSDFSFLQEFLGILLMGLAGLAVAGVLYFNIKKQDAGSEKMQKISDKIHSGAMAFLKAEYSKLGIFALAVAILLWVTFSWKTSGAFLLGSMCSALAGFVGMKAATRGNVRTAQAAAQKGLAEAFLVAFNGGAVMGLAVARLGSVGFGRPLHGFSSSGGIPYCGRSPFPVEYYFWFFHGGLFYCSFCPNWWWHFHQGGRCGIRSGG